MLNKKHLGCKISVRPIRSNIANRHVRLYKTLISADAKKLLTRTIFNTLNDYDWLCHLATFFVPKRVIKVAK